MKSKNKTLNKGKEPLIKTLNDFEKWLINNKKGIILTSYIVVPVIISINILNLIIQPVSKLFTQYILMFLALPLLTHYFYLNFKDDNNMKKNIFRKSPTFWILLVIFLGSFIYTFFYKNIPKNIESTLIAFWSMLISYRIAKTLLTMQAIIKRVVLDKDTDKFKMYMQLINKTLLSILTIVASILSILLTIKQLLAR